jgi:hypothetical protein
MLHLRRALTPSRRSAVLASHLGWTVDAFDFFVLVSSWTTSRKNSASGERRLTVKVTKELGKFGYANSLNFENGLETDAREY